MYFLQPIVAIFTAFGCIHSLYVDYYEFRHLVLHRDAMAELAKGLADPHVGIVGGPIYYPKQGSDARHVLACKIRRLGKTVKVVSTPVSYHMVWQSAGSSTKGTSSQGFYPMNRNMFYFYASQLPGICALSSILSEFTLGFSRVGPVPQEKSIRDDEGRRLLSCITIRQEECDDEEKKELDRLGRLPIAPRD